jgi:hypothetical protein
MSGLYVEMPDAALRWAGPAMIGVDGGTISSSVPLPLPPGPARDLVAKLQTQGRRATLYRKEGRRLVLVG